MTEGPEPPRRPRGRPRLPEDEKKRRNMTFRMRDDLRTAVERIADENGRSLSEQVEFFVEQCVFAYARREYEFSFPNKLAPTTKSETSKNIKKNALDASIDTELNALGLEKSPKSGVLKKLTQEMHRHYVELCERIERKSIEIEAENEKLKEELREELENRFKVLTSETNKTNRDSE